MSKKHISTSSEPASDKAGQDRFPVPFTLEQFKIDILWLYFLHVKLVAAIADDKAALRLLEKQPGDGHFAIKHPAEAGLTYPDIRTSWLARSLESMYRYAYLGQRDYSVEELGPGGYHVGIAAIVRDMARSSHRKFLLEIEPERKDSVDNCLRTVELANARLTLEGQPRFFNFDSKDEDEDYINLISGGAADTPQGGFGAALTVRQMALLSGLEELSIRTFANPKRANQIPTETRFGRTLIPIDAAKAWLKSKGRYVTIRPSVDGAALELENRQFVTVRELHSVVRARLSGQSNDIGRDAFQELTSKFGFMNDDMAAYTNVQFVRALAVKLALPVDLFVLRVKEVMLNDDLAMVRRQLLDAVRGD